MIEPCIKITVYIQQKSLEFLLRALLFWRNGGRFSLSFVALPRIEFASGSARNPTPLDLRIYAFNLFGELFQSNSPFQKVSLSVYKISGVCLSSTERSDVDLYQDKHTPGSQFNFLRLKLLFVLEIFTNLLNSQDNSIAIVN